MDLRWESGLKLSFTNDKNPNAMGCKFVGDEGWVHVDRSGIWAEPASLLKIEFKPSDTRLHASPEHSNPYTAHTADFFRSLRTRQDPVSPIESGQAASTLGNVCDISLRLGRKLKWDPAQDRFLGDDEANAMLSRPHRSPWEI
jgi:hypothetical protein